MLNGLVFLHIAFSALWLGCVLTEAIFERTLLADGADRYPILAQLHYRVDLIVELPAMFGVTATGVAMLMRAGVVDPLLTWKIAFGILALATNLWCFVLVLRRRDRAIARDAAGFLRLDHLQHRIGALVLASLLAAMVTGYLRLQSP